MMRRMKKNKNDKIYRDKGGDDKKDDDDDNVDRDSGGDDGATVQNMQYDVPEKSEVHKQSSMNEQSNVQKQPDVHIGGPYEVLEDKDNKRTESDEESENVRKRLKHSRETKQLPSMICSPYRKRYNAIK